jgi:hypothetical protein
MIDMFPAPFHTEDESLFDDTYESPRSGETHLV